MVDRDVASLLDKFRRNGIDTSVMPGTPEYDAMLEKLAAVTFNVESHDYRVTVGMTGIGTLESIVISPDAYRSRGSAMAAQSIAAGITRAEQVLAMTVCAGRERHARKGA